MKAPGIFNWGKVFISLFLMMTFGANAGEVIVSWDRNNEQDLAGYRIHYGTSSGNYTNIIDVGNHTSHAINNLTDGLSYYFVVTAYDNIGNESDYSHEKSAYIIPSDTTAPTIKYLVVIDNRNIDIQFSEEIDESSAENMTNYRINNGVTIQSINLDSNQRTVHLRTSIQQPGNYTITVNNIFDKAVPPNEILDNTSATYQILDTTPPNIVNVIATDENHVNISFSEPLNQISAVNKNNYTINNKIQILTITLNSDGRTVHLATTPHAEATYTLTLNHVQDAAIPANEIVPNSRFEYDYVDRVSPLINNVNAVAENQVAVIFNEPVTRNTAENRLNYSINNGIIIQSAALDQDQVTVHLITSAHTESVYQIRINNIEDQAATPNVIAPNSVYNYQYVDLIPPRISNVYMISENQLVVEFSEPVETVSATNKINYSINGNISIIQTSLESNNKIVTLETSRHAEGIYTISVNNILDLAENANSIAQNSQFQYEYVDTIPPAILNAHAGFENRVIVEFSEEIQIYSAENKNNYAISGGVLVEQARLENNQKIVILTTSPHSENNYRITINNIKDLANLPNTIASNSSFDYQYIDTTPPQIVNVRTLSEDQVEIEFSESIAIASAENKNNYNISNGIVVSNATLNSNQKVVILSTSNHIESAYSIFVNNVTDRANTPNLIATNSRFNYEYVDHTAPQIVSVQALVDNQVDITFSEDLEENSAENISNFSINQGVTIYSSILDNNKRAVHLLTSKHAPGYYIITIRNVKDNSSQQNLILADSEFSYEYIDLMPPTVIDVWAPDDIHVDVTFNEPVENQSAENIINYHINNSIEIYSIELGENHRIAHFTTSVHQPQQYVLSASNIKDRAVNQNKMTEVINFSYIYVDRIPPQITDVRAVNDTSVAVTFSEPVGDNAVENLSNYGINRGIVVRSALLESDNLTVQLLTTVHSPGQYIITVNNIVDRAATPNMIADNSTYNYQYLDRKPPAIFEVVALNENFVNISFDEPVDRNSAENRNNYRINNGISINSLQLDVDGSTVHLETSRHSPGWYQITVNNILDRAVPPNTILPNSSGSYEYIDRTPPAITVVQAMDARHITVTFSEAMEEISTESVSNYAINGGIVVESAELNTANFTVILTTTSHVPGNYTLSVSNVRDAAVNPNTILPGSQLSYEYIDRTPPTVVTVNAFFEDSVDVEFSERMEQQSAQNKSNYSISGGIQILEAVLDQNKKNVHLKTSIHAENNYVITINNVKDDAADHNEIEDNTTASYNYVDTTPPSLIFVNTPLENEVVIFFSELVSEASAENLSNYSITGNINIEQAVLENNGKVVHLTTSAHSENNYRLTVRNIKDRAFSPNVIVSGSYLDYLYIDRTLPVISQVLAMSDTGIDVIFSELIAKNSAENISNYQVTSGVNITGALLDANNFTVHLITNPHTENTYILTVSNIKDRAITPNVILPASQFEYQFVDLTPPEVINAQALIENQVVIQFSEPVEKNSAENIANYAIDGNITVHQASLDQNNTTVHLTTSPHLERVYAILFNNIKDRAINPNTINENSLTQYEYVDLTAPLIVAIQVLPENNLEIVFSEPVGKASAENTANYLITPSIAVHQALLADDQKTVRLQTGAHAELKYTLNINEIRDRANQPNVIAAGSSIQYQYLDVVPPTIVNAQLVSEDSLILTFSETIDEVTAENKGNYQINQGINILSVSQNGNNRSVTILTTKHEEGSYTITINNVKDRAITPNKIAQNTLKDYQFIDTIAPRIVTVLSLSENAVQLIFDEPVQKASAEKAGNYTINRGITVQSAVLSASQTVVQLTTSKHAEGIFNLSTKNIFDQANVPNAIKTNNSIQYEYVDQIPPMIADVRTVAVNQVEVKFSELVAKNSAENAANYEITGGISIHSAVLQNDTLTVRLETSAHVEGNYKISVSQIEDLAHSPNKIIENSEKYYDYTDRIKPFIVNVTAINPNQIDIRFSEAVEQNSAENTNNYNINNDIIVESVNLDADGRTVHLQTTIHQSGSYIIIVNNIIDRANQPNMIQAHSYFSYQYMDMIPPEIINVKILDATHVDVTFSEKVECLSAEKMENYQILLANEFEAEVENKKIKNQNKRSDDFIDDDSNNVSPGKNVTIHAITLDSNERIAHIQTSEHQPGNYFLKINNVKDKAADANKISQNKPFRYQFIDVIPPEISSSEILDGTHIKIVFSEVITETSATNIANYMINKGVFVLNSALEIDRRTVRLTTTAHQNGETYRLTLNNIADCAQKHNTILPNTMINYVYVNHTPDRPATLFLYPVENVGCGGLQLKWERAVENNIIGYKIYYGTSTQNYNTYINAGNVLEYTVTGLIESAEYYFAVTARNNYGLESKFSNEQSAIVEMIDLTAPTIIAVNAVNDSELVVVFSEKIDSLTAIKIENYQINHGIRVLSAYIFSNKRMVRLNTSQHSPGEYEILIKNICDLAASPNIIASNSKYNYTYFPSDNISPVITNINVVNKNNIKLTFSENVEKNTAENKENYQIDQNVNIISAIMSANQRMVHLFTTDHQVGTEYVLSVQNIQDRAMPANTILPETKIDYRYDEDDVIAPEIYYVQIKAENLLEISFTEMIRTVTAENINNYFISENVTSIKATLKADQKTVILETTPHGAGNFYTLTAANICDFAEPANVIGNKNSYQYNYFSDDHQSPVIVSATAKDKNQVDIVFNEFLKRSSAENIANYFINKGIQVIEAKLDPVQNKVHLITSQHISGERYTLTIANLKDASIEQNCIEPNSRIEYVYLYADIKPPMIESCLLIDAQHLIVNFNELIERESAENPDNYSINNGTKIFEIALDSNLKTVLLRTSNHESGLKYRLLVSHVKDRAAVPNIICPNTEYFYQSNSPVSNIVDNLNPVNYQLAYLDVGLKFYIDRELEIQTTPDELSNCLWIKTAQEDSGNSQNALISFVLKEKATIYVAFDPRAINYPDWLIDNFYRTGQKIEVAAEIKYFDLWVMESDSGQIVLGGNLAAGAEGVKNMYVVIIKSESMMQLALPDGMKDPKTKERPQTYFLTQNYPNPFNAGTSLKFQLPIEAFVEIKIYNILGQLVTTLVEDMKSAGNFIVRWNGQNRDGLSVPSGIYFARMIVKNLSPSANNKNSQQIYTKVRKMVLVK